MALSAKRQAFVEEYVVCLNASEAARRAGYSGHTAGVQGHALLKNDGVREAIESRLGHGRTQRVAEARERVRVKVYLIRAENGLVKIGKTIDVDRRLRSLNTASPVALRLIHVFETLFGDELEEELQAAYEHKRVKGEWFALTDKDVKAIIKSYGQAD